MKIGYNELNRYNLFIIIILIGLFLHKLNKRQFNVYNDTGQKRGILCLKII